MLRSLFNKVQATNLQLYQKEDLAQVFSCEFCEVSDNNFFIEHLLATASEHNKTNLPLMVYITF